MNQRQEAQRFPHLLIRASAGTGKTYQLSSRFLGLLRSGAGCDQILATTFTRKAAGEILDRVILRLAQATQDPTQRKQLQAGTGGGRLMRRDCLALLEELMRQLHRLRVGTLDSFFSQVSRSFSLELGLPPGWEILDELVDTRLRREAIHTVLSDGDPAELRTLIQLLIKGEATRGVSQLIHETISGLYNLFLATGEEAWHQVPRPRPLATEEVAAAIEELRGLDLPVKRMSTARDADCARAVAADWESFLDTGLAKKVLDGDPTFASKPIPPEAVAIYQRLIDHVRAVVIGRVALQTEASYRLLERFHRQYVQLKHERRGLRFEDVTRELAALREAVPLDRMAFRLDSRIEHLVLDEFQDTSPEQWRVLQPLAEYVTAAGGAGLGEPGPREDGGRSFFCVGDVKQAIYGWRGGVAEIFDAIDRQLPGLQPLSQNTSYRSSPVVIETVNRVFGGLPEHPNLRQAEGTVRQWCARFEPHATHRTELAGYAELRTAPEAGEDQAQRDVTLQFAAEQIAALVRRAPGRSVGVLVRKNATVGQLIYLLRTQHVLASEEGGNPLTDSAAVLVVLSALHLADHPGDSVARFHLVHSPLAEAVGLSSHTDSRAAADAAQRIRQAVVGDGYGPTLLGWARRLVGHCNRRELSRLEQLVEEAYRYDSNATLRTADFVQHVQCKRVADPVPADVRVMTIHQAKGLEFDIVVLPELDADLVGQPEAFVMDRPQVDAPIRQVCRYANQQVQKLMPSALQTLFCQAIEREVSESLCVLYVALTRAVHALHAIIPPSKGNEKAFPRSFAGLLRIALAGDQPAAADTVLYRHGDRDWHQHPGDGQPERSAAEAARAAQDLEPVRIELAPATGPRRRGWERTSPSRMEGGSFVRIDRLLSSQSKAPAFVRGQLIHAWFEQIQWLEDGLPSEQRLREVAAEVLAAAGSPRQNLTEPLESFRAMLQQPAIAGLLCRSRYAEPAALAFPAEVQAVLNGQALTPGVQNERGFAYREGDRLINGFIDRLVLLHQGPQLAAAEILDFKTDTLTSRRGETLADKIAFYAPQLQAYRRAVCCLTGLPPQRIAARLVFLQAARVETIAW